MKWISLFFILLILFGCTNKVSETTNSDKIEIASDLINILKTNSDAKYFLENEKLELTQKVLTADEVIFYKENSSYKEAYTNVPSKALIEVNLKNANRNFIATIDPSTKEVLNFYAIVNVDLSIKDKYGTPVNS